MLLVAFTLSSTPALAASPCASSPFVGTWTSNNLPGTSNGFNLVWFVLNKDCTVSSPLYTQATTGTWSSTGSVLKLTLTTIGSYSGFSLEADFLATGLGNTASTITASTYKSINVALLESSVTLPPGLKIVRFP
jgi:hypothetical protein